MRIGPPRSARFFVRGRPPLIHTPVPSHPLQGRKPLSKRTLGDKENDFIEALRVSKGDREREREKHQKPCVFFSPAFPPPFQAFYFDGAPTMSNEEFENLREELTWAGSKVAVLSPDELKFLEAATAFRAGRPILADADYDALKRKLKRDASMVTAQGPRCSLRSGRLYSDAAPDYLLMTALNLPATLLTLAALFSIDDLTGFEITKFIELPEPWGIVVVWGFVLPVVYVLSSSLTNLVIRDAVILKAPCPNCGSTVRSYFGDVLTVAGTGRDGVNNVECGSCGAKLAVDGSAREAVVTQLPGGGGAAAKPKAA